MAHSLELGAKKLPPPSMDKHYDEIDKDLSTQVQLTMMPCLATVSKDLWDKPASLSPTSGGVEALYKIYDTEVNFLSKHPPLNLIVVQAALARAKGRQVSTPTSKDGRKMDSMGWHLYSTASLALWIAKKLWVPILDSWWPNSNHFWTSFRRNPMPRPPKSTMNPSP